MNGENDHSPTDRETSISLNNFPLADRCHTCTRTRDFCCQFGESYPDCYRQEQSNSIDKLIVEREENFDFDEMTAQMAGKLMIHFSTSDYEYDDEADQTDDENVATYEKIKDIIRDHLVEWLEKGDTLNVKVD